VLKHYEYPPPTSTTVEKSFDTSEDCKDWEEEEESNNHDSLMEDFRTLQLAFDGVQKLLAEQESRIAEEKLEFMNLVRSNMQEKLESELTAVSTYIQGLKGTIQDLRQKVNSLQTTVNKYKKSWSQWKIKTPSH
jgi:flagellar biosynthesis chaperone FliJ